MNTLLAAALASTCLLSACSKAPLAAPASGQPSALSAMAAPKLPMPKGGALTDGFAARESSAIASDALADYVTLARRWDRTWGDRAKDALEEQMLSVMKRALDRVQDVTSREGHDTADRRAYDIADRGLDRYETLYREWQATYSRERRRLVVNEMLAMLVRTLEDIRDNG
jgi:hypothetical protein